jgi:ABC-2 type transport system ATP-binding protein
MTPDPSQLPLVEVRGLEKRYGRTRALTNVSFELARGHIVGLLGPNGSGKTTLLQQLLGIERPSAGECRVFGTPAPKLGNGELARIGFVAQEGQLLDWLTVDEHVRFVASFYAEWDDDYVEAFLSRFELPKDRRVGKLSTGNRQKLAVLLATASRPDLVLLDEPAAAMDPITRSEFLELLVELVQDGERTIVVSSHILSDVERVVDRVLILREGRLVRDASLDELRERYCQVHLTALEGRLPSELPFPGVVESRTDERQAVLTLRSETPFDWDALESAAQQAHCRAELRPVPFDDIYRLEVTRPAAPQPMSKAAAPAVEARP